MPRLYGWGGSARRQKCRAGPVMFSVQVAYGVIKGGSKSESWVCAGSRRLISSAPVRLD